MHNDYNISAFRQFRDQQVRVTGREGKIAQLERAEELLAEIESDRSYVFHELCSKITALRFVDCPCLEVTGPDVRHDLRLLLEDLSDSANIPAEAAGERVWTIDELSRRFDVTQKTVSRWRDQGLASRKFVFGGRKRIGFLQSTVERFVEKNAERVWRGRQFSRLSAEEREGVVEAARTLAAKGGNLSEILTRLSSRFNRSKETIRYILWRHDNRDPADAIIYETVRPFSAKAKQDLYSQYREGTSVESLARRFKRSRTSIYRIIGQMRVPDDEGSLDTGSPKGAVDADSSSEREVLQSTFSDKASEPTARVPRGLFPKSPGSREPAIPAREQEPRGSYGQSQHVHQSVEHCELTRDAWWGSSRIKPVLSPDTQDAFEKPGILAFAQRLTGEKGVWPWGRALRRSSASTSAGVRRVMSRRRIGPRTLRRVIEDCRRAPEFLRDCLLPQPPLSWSLKELGLKRRLQRTLATHGFGVDTSQISELTVSEAVQIPGVGLGGLLRLLAALERVPCIARTHIEQVGMAEGAAVTLDHVLRIPGALELSSEDPRLGKSSRAVDRSCPSLGLLVMRGTGLSPVPLTVDQFGALHELCRQIELLDYYPLEAEFFDICYPTLRGRNREIVATFFGFRSRESETLKTIGTKFGITKERVRQICCRTAIANTDVRIFAPKLDRVLQFVRDSLPASASSIHEALVVTGLLGASTTLETVAKVGKILHRELGFVVFDDGSDLAVSARDQHAALTIRRCVRRLLSKHGVTTCEALLQGADQALHGVVAQDFILKIIEGTPGFRWLDRASGWFWIDSGQYNSLRSRIRRVLSVAPRIRVSELRNAIRRDYRYDEVAPPARVLLEFCRGISDCRVEGEEIIAEETLDPARELRGDERIIARLLSEYGPVCPRQFLQQKVMEAGVSEPSFWRCMSYSPVVARYDSGVFGLPGARLEPGEVEAMSAKRRTKRVLQDHGWTQNGHIWLTYRLSGSTLQSGVISMPAAKSDIVQGEFKLIDSSGKETGKLVVRGHSAWGLGPVLRKMGAEEGDYLRIEISLPGRTGIALVGDDSLLEECERSHLKADSRLSHPDL